MFADDLYLMRQRFASSVTSTFQLTGIDIDNKWYSTHSFRIGAVPTAKEAGISDVHIKVLGKWKSSVYQLMSTPHRSGLQDSRNKW